MITGYFLCGSQAPRLTRLTSIIILTFFYAIPLFFFGVSQKYETPVLKGPLPKPISMTFLPITGNTYWFVSSYVCISCLLPFYKTWFDSMEPQVLIHTVIVMFAVYELPRLFTLVISNYFSTLISFSAASFYVLLGYSIHRNEKQLSCKEKYSVVVILLTSLLFFVFAGPISHLLKHISLDVSPYSFSQYWACATVVYSACMLVIFSHLHFTSRVINFLSKSTFGAYLIHDNPYIREWLWKGKGYLKVSSHSLSDSTAMFIWYTIGIILLVYAVSSLIDTCRLLLFSIPSWCLRYCRTLPKRGRQRREFKKQTITVEMNGITPSEAF